MPAHGTVPAAGGGAAAAAGVALGGGAGRRTSASSTGNGGKAKASPPPRAAAAAAKASSAAVRPPPVPPRTVVAPTTQVPSSASSTSSSGSSDGASPDEVAQLLAEAKDFVPDASGVKRRGTYALRAHIRPAGQRDPYWSNKQTVAEAKKVYELDEKKDMWKQIREWARDPRYVSRVAPGATTTVVRNGRTVREAAPDTWTTPGGRVTTCPRLTPSAVRSAPYDDVKRTYTDLKHFLRANLLLAEIDYLKGQYIVEEKPAGKGAAVAATWFAEQARLVDGEGAAAPPPMAYMKFEWPGCTDASPLDVIERVHHAFHEFLGVEEPESDGESDGEGILGGGGDAADDDDGNLAAAVGGDDDYDEEDDEDYVPPDAKRARTGSTGTGTDDDDDSDDDEDSDASSSSSDGSPDDEDDVLDDDDEEDEDDDDDDEEEEDEEDDEEDEDEDEDDDA